MVDPRAPPGRRRLQGNWNADGIVVDGYRADGVPWPVETTRYAYLTPYGGHSADVGPGAVGLNRQALVENTDLAEGDRVTITVYETGSPVPFMFRQAFEVMALDFSTPDAFLHSVDGEAVLSEREPEPNRQRLGAVRDGVKLVLNGVLRHASA